MATGNVDDNETRLAGKDVRGGVILEVMGTSRKGDQTPISAACCKYTVGCYIYKCKCHMNVREIEIVREIGVPMCQCSPLIME